MALQDWSELARVAALEAIDHALAEAQATLPAVSEHAKSVASSMGARQLTIQGDPNAERFYIAAGGVLMGRTESGSIPGRFLPTFSVSLTGNNAA